MFLNASPVTVVRGRARLIPRRSGFPSDTWRRHDHSALLASRESIYPRLLAVLACFASTPWLLHASTALGLNQIPCCLFLYRLGRRQAGIGRHLLRYNPCPTGRRRNPILQHISGEGDLSQGRAGWPSAALPLLLTARLGNDVVKPKFYPAPFIGACFNVLPPLAAHAYLEAFPFWPMFIRPRVILQPHTSSSVR